MNKTEQRIAIAEACGWPSSTCNINHALQEIGGKWWALTLPDYLSDLNAMHEAEKVLTESQKWEQSCLIANYQQHNGGFPLFSRSEVITLAKATAAQRVEAFLKTLNLWETS